MKWLADYIMRRRFNAVVVTTLSTVLLVVIPPLAHVSAATLGLVLLRLGLKEALSVALAASALIVGLGFVSGGGMALALSLLLVIALMFWLPTLGLGLLLRSSASYAMTVQVAAISYVVVLLGFYLMVGSPYEWWKALFEPRIDLLMNQMGLSRLEMDAETLVDEVAKLMTGVMIASLLLLSLFNVMLARWWQSLLYNEGGYAEEFQALRLGRNMAIITVALVLISFLPINTALVTDVLFILGACYFLQGMAVVHAVSKQINLHRGWMITLYVLLLFIPQAMLVIASLGLIDNRADFRARLIKQPH